MVIYNQKPLWVILLIYCLSFWLFSFLQLQLQKTQYLQLGQNRGQYYGGSLPNVNQIGNTTIDLPFQVRSTLTGEIKNAYVECKLCTDIFKFVGFHQTTFQNSGLGLDTSRTTRHHGLVDRVYRDRTRITSPHRRPLSVDKHGRLISLMTLVTNADRCFGLCGLRKHICFKCLRFTYSDIMKSLMLNLTLIAVRMPLCICHPHLIPAGGGESLYSHSLLACAEDRTYVQE